MKWQNMSSFWKDYPETGPSLATEMVKNLPTMRGDLGSIPWSRSFLGEGHGNPLQCSCLEKPMDRGAWRDTVQGVAKNRTRLNNEYFLLSFSRNQKVNQKPFEMYSTHVTEGVFDVAFDKMPLVSLGVMRA